MLSQPTSSWALIIEHCLGGDWGGVAAAGRPALVGNQGCYAMALIRMMIHESSYLDLSLLVNPTLRQPIGCVIQLVGRHQRLGKNEFKPKDFHHYAIA